MKPWVGAATALFLCFVGQAQGGPGDASGEDAVADLLLGQCLSEVTHTPAPAGAMAPLSQVPAPIASHDTRLSPRALLIPTRNGTVYLDHHGGTCEVFATGVDHTAIVVRLQLLIAARRLPARRPPSDPSSASPGTREDIFSIGGLGAASIPIIRVTSADARRGDVSASVTVYRQINVTSDSAPGWSPSDQQATDAEARMRAFYAAVDGGDYAPAYAMMADVQRQGVPYEGWVADRRSFNSAAGPVRDHRIVRVTWTKDPPSAPVPGVYAAIDVVSRYANIDRHCGYIVVYQPPAGGPFQVMRTEDNYITNPQARTMGDRVESLWAQLSSSCPNYADGPADAAPVAPHAPTL